MQGGNAGAGQIFELLQDGLSRANQLVALGRSANLQEFLDVGACSECPLRSSEDDSPDGWIVVERLQCADEFAEKKRLQERQLGEAGAAKDKNWGEREKVLAAAASEIVSWRRGVLADMERQGVLSLDAEAKTFRYLDEEEIAKQRAAAKAKEKGKK